MAQDQELYLNNMSWYVTELCSTIVVSWCLSSFDPESNESEVPEIVQEVYRAIVEPLDSWERSLTLWKRAAASSATPQLWVAR